MWFIPIVCHTTFGAPIMTTSLFTADLNTLCLHMISSICAAVPYNHPNNTLSSCNVGKNLGRAIGTYYPTDHTFNLRRKPEGCPVTSAPFLDHWSNVRTSHLKACLTTVKASPVTPWCLPAERLPTRHHLERSCQLTTPAHDQTSPRNPG